MASSLGAKELKAREDWEEVLQSVETVLFDCDGVLWTGDGEPVAGAQDALQFIRSKGKKVCFVSNNSSKSRSEYLQRFQKLGMTAYKEEVFCTSYVAAHYLKHSLRLQGKAYLLGMPGFAHELDLQGLRYTGPGEDPVLESNAEMLETALDPEVEAVVVGFDRYFNLMKLLKACSYLRQPECHFIATNEDQCLPSKTHIRFPGTGCLVEAVAYGSERKPTVLGKPHLPMLNAIQESIDLSPARTLMIGDRLNTDIVFGRKNGLQTLLVMTGVTQQNGLMTAPQDQIPDYYSQSIADILVCSPGKS